MATGRFTSPFQLANILSHFNPVNGNSKKSETPSILVNSLRIAFARVFKFKIKSPLRKSIEMYRQIDSGYLARASAYGVILMTVILIPVYLAIRFLKLDLFSSRNP